MYNSSNSYTGLPMRVKSVIESEIVSLCAEADKLRKLDQDDPKALPLGAIVDRINALRFEQATAPEGEPEEPKRGPGRPAKAAE
jgi:hypothetical protein